ncbi:Global transcription regulator sge1 [Lecanora helva]
MNTGKAPACVPTWKGHIETTKDALIIFEACFAGRLAHCFRRPHDRERNQLIVSGNVFVYEEATSGIKRWTDGIPWSPSRILTNFLIYRQLNSPFPPGEKKRATKRSQRSIKPGEPYPTSASSTPVTDESRPFPPQSPNPSIRTEESQDKDTTRGLVGSLVDSYEFKENGLLKKTMTVSVNHVQHHLVSYYSLEDAKHNLGTPRDDPTLRDLRIREALLNQPKFKYPNFDDAGDGTCEQMEGHPNAYAGYGFPTNGYDPRVYASMQIAQQASSPMNFQSVYGPSQQPATTSSGYSSLVPTTSPYGAAVQYPTQAPMNHQHHYAQMNQQHPYQNQPSAQPQFQTSQFSGHPQEQMQHSGYQPHGMPNGSSRPNGLIDYGGAHHENDLGHDPYSSTAIKLEGSLPTSQSQQQHTWPMPQYAQSQQPWMPRTNGATFNAFRQQP